jgi:hypothetical protein
MLVEKMYLYWENTFSTRIGLFLFFIMNNASSVVNFFQIYDIGIKMVSSYIAFLKYFNAPRINIKLSINPRLRNFVVLIKELILTPYV